MPKDSFISELDNSAELFASLKQERAGERDSFSRAKQESILSQLKASRDSLKRLNPDFRLDQSGIAHIQERGMWLQLEFEDLIINSPAQFLERLPAYVKEHSLSEEERRIFEAIAKESQFRHFFLKGILDAFVRKAKEHLPTQEIPPPAEGDDFDRSNPYWLYQDKLSLEVGRIIFLARTGKNPSKDVYWIQTPLAITICTTSFADHQVLCDQDPNAKAIVGTFNRSMELDVHLITGEANDPPFLVPFIHFQDYAHPQALEHETAHAEHDMISSGVDRYSKLIKQILIGFERRSHTWELDNATYDEVKGLLKNSDELTNDEVLDEIFVILENGAWDQALFRCKDEVISDFRATNTFEQYHRLKMSIPQPKWNSERNVRTGQSQKGVYDDYYYLRPAGITASLFESFGRRPVYDDIATNYNSILIHNVGYIESVWQQMSADPEKVQRAKWKLIAFMRQNPIYTWEERGIPVFGGNT